MTKFLHQIIKIFRAWLQNPYSKIKMIISLFGRNIVWNYRIKFLFCSTNCNWKRNNYLNFRWRTFNNNFFLICSPATIKLSEQGPYSEIKLIFRYKCFSLCSIVLLCAMTMLHFCFVLLFRFFIKITILFLAAKHFTYNLIIHLMKLVQNCYLLISEIADYKSFIRFP